jgi:PAS domain S-box-containing protein
VSDAGPELDKAQIAEALSVGIACVDPVGRQNYVNKAFADLVGWSVAELMGAEPPFVYWPPEELERIQEALQRTVAGESSPDGFELVFMRRDGTRLDVLVSISPILAGDQVIAWAAAVTPIGRLKEVEAALLEKEQRLSLALSAGRLGSWEFELAGDRVEWSAGLERIHGIPEGSFGGTFEDYVSDIHPDDLEQVLVTISESSRGRAPHHLLYRIVRPDGEIRWLEAHGRLMLDASGRAVRMVGICADVTERVEVEEATRRARDAAEEANRSKAAFLAAMSHELRTPLNAIGGYLDLIDAGIYGPVTEAQKQALLRVKKSQAYLLRLITDLLQFARLEAGRLEFREEHFELGEVVAAIAPMFATEAAASGVEYVHDDCATAPTVCGDPARVQQILSNLLGNAVKYTPAGGRISLSCSADDAHVYVRVRDTGPGIPAESHESIFHPFVQMGEATAIPSGGGVGLGLAISRDLARAMNGDITVQSEPGAGSTFIVSLPRAH